MKLKTLLILADILGLLAIGAPAVAQSVTTPTVSTLDQQNDRVQVVPNGQPSARSVYASPAQLSAVHAYYKLTPVTGFDFTFSNDEGIAMFTPAGTIAEGTVFTAPNPSDGTEECVFSTKQITLFAFWPNNTNQTVNNGLTQIAANGHACYVFSTSTSAWDRAE